MSPWSPAERGLVLSQRDKTYHTTIFSQLQRDKTHLGKEVNAQTSVTTFDPFPDYSMADRVSQLMTIASIVLHEIPLNVLVILLFVLGILYGFAWHDRPAK